MSEFTAPTNMSATSPAFPVAFETLIVRQDGGVLFVEIASPPMNLLGPELVRDLVSLIQHAEADDAVRVLVFKSADPDYFISHVDLTRVTEYRAEAAKLTGEASIGLLFRHLSVSRLVSIAQIEGRVRAAGSEFVLACDMRFAARESAIFGQFEPAFGQLPGGGRCPAPHAPHGSRASARGDAERRGLRRRGGGALRLDQPRAAGRCASGFVSSLAHRIAGFPAAGQVAVKERVNAIALAPVEDFRRDSDLFGEEVRAPDAQRLIAAALKQGFQTRGAELALSQMLGELTAPAP